MGSLLQILSFINTHLLKESLLERFFTFHFIPTLTTTDILQKHHIAKNGLQLYSRYSYGSRVAKNI